MVDQLGLIIAIQENVSVLGWMKSFLAGLQQAQPLLLELYGLYLVISSDHKLQFGTQILLQR